VPQAVEQLPGVWGQATNRGAGSPLLRGLIGPQNLIVIDGLRLNTAVFRTGPNQYLGTIDASAVDELKSCPDRLANGPWRVARYRPCGSTST
jgi:hypothetical protein